MLCDLLVAEINSAWEKRYASDESESDHSKTTCNKQFNLFKVRAINELEIYSYGLQNNIWITVIDFD